MGAERAQHGHEAGTRPLVKDRPTRSPLDSATVRRAVQPAGGTSTLRVGAADDSLERDADATADSVMAYLRGASGSSRGGTTQVSERMQRSAIPVAAPPTSDGGRLQRLATAPGSAAGPAGGELDVDTANAIQRARGSSAGTLPDRVQAGMAQVTGSDVSGVRVHTGAEASRLSESIGAQAFTLGNDIFMHDRAPAIGTSAGDELLAHEASHVVQQGAAATLHRKMWSKEMFDKSTNEGALVRRSKAQIAIRKMLVDYHTTYAWERQLAMSAPEANDAMSRVAEMRDVAKMWIGDHTVTKGTDEYRDPSRQKRRAGMDGFVDACNLELMTLRDLADYKKTGDVDKNAPGVENVAITNPSEHYSTVKAKYTGDATSAFRKLGFLIDGAVPADGDSAKIALAVKIPIGNTGGYLGFEFQAESKRNGDYVESGCNVGVTGGATIGVASIDAALGGFIKATAKSGADAAELMSYAMFRRCRETNLLPREIESLLWGGGRTGGYAWYKAEDWSLGVEQRIFENDANASVETGAYGSVGAKAKLGKIAEIGGTLKGTVGTKIDQSSLNTRKGGAGKDNLRSGAAKDSGNVSNYDRRGAQKSVGVGTGGFELGVAGKFGPLSGEFKGQFGWTSDGAHGKKSLNFTTFVVGGTIAGTMPLGELVAGGVGNLIPKVVESVNRLIRLSAAQAQDMSAAKGAGHVVDEVAGYGAIVASLAAVPAKTWSPFDAPGAAKAGLTGGATTKIGLSLGFDFKKGEFVAELTMEKAASIADQILDNAGEAFDLFKLELTKSQRLLKLTYAGSKWTVS